MESYSNSAITIFRILEILLSNKNKLTSVDEICRGIEAKDRYLILNSNTPLEQMMSYLGDIKLVKSQPNGKGMKYQITDAGIQGFQKLKPRILKNIPA